MIDILRFSLHKIDHTNNVILNQQTDQNSNLEDYIKEILDYVSKPDEKRIYNFPNGSLVAPAILEMLDEDSFILRANHNANRLLGIELNVQEAMQRFTEIQRGILIQAVINLADTQMVIIAKADFSGYLSEHNNYKPEEGLPLKRKIFKAFCSSYNSTNELIDIFVFDPHNTKYWWREFFELDQDRTDESNTEKAFEAIDDTIYKLLKKEHPADHNIIRNSIVGHFKTEKRQFSMSTMIFEIIQNHVPLNPDFPRDGLISKLNALAQRSIFDGQFEIIPKVITAKKLKEIIPLTDKMDLLIKEHIPTLSTDVKPLKINGEKYIQIKTDGGYAAFGGKE